jgi:type I site-specific restriction endonuclease
LSHVCASETVQCRLENAQISEQRSFTDRRIVIAGSRPIRRPQKRADYLLRYRRDFPIAVVEAKAVYRTPGGGLQQAKEYAQILGLKFAYASNISPTADKSEQQPELSPRERPADPRQEPPRKGPAGFDYGLRRADEA